MSAASSICARATGWVLLRESAQSIGRTFADDKAPVA